MVALVCPSKNHDTTNNPLPLCAPCVIHQCSRELAPFDVVQLDVAQLIQPVYAPQWWNFQLMRCPCNTSSAKEGPGVGNCPTGYQNYTWTSIGHYRRRSKYIAGPGNLNLVSAWLPTITLTNCMSIV